MKDFTVFLDIPEMKTHSQEDPLALNVSQSVDLIRIKNFKIFCFGDVMLFV